MLVSNKSFFYSVSPLFPFTGAVSAQVHAGPMAYAEAFLSNGAAAKLKIPAKYVESLKNIFR